MIKTIVTLFAAAWLLDEVVEWHSWLVAALVAGQVYLAKRLA